MLLAFAEEPTPGMGRPLLRSVAADLPERLYAHLAPPHLVDALSPMSRSPRPRPVPHCKLGLVDPTALERHDTDEGESSSPRRSSPRSTYFYRRAYPGTWFQARMLETHRQVRWASAGTAS